MNPKVKIAIAVSGKGRSLANFLAVEAQYPFEVAAVISSSPKAQAAEIAAKHNLPLFVGDFSQDLSAPLNDWLREKGVRWVALAGFLKPFPSLPSFENCVINIHPSLLPLYGGHGMYGKRVHAAVLAAGERKSGATVHFVNERYDEGSVIAQAAVEIEGIQSEEDLAARIFALECDFYPEVLSRLIKQEIPLNEGRVWLFEKD